MQSDHSSTKVVLDLSWPDAADTACHGRKQPVLALPGFWTSPRIRHREMQQLHFRLREACMAATGSVPARNTATSGPDATRTGFLACPPETVLVACIK